MSDHLSISSIAREAHVSVTTVSRVFRNSGYVSEETRRRVLLAAEKYHYQPKQYKQRSSRSAANAIVGVIVADLQNVFFLEIINNLSRVLSEQGINVVVCDSGESTQQEIRCLNMLHRQHVDGIIITPVSETAEYNTEFLTSIDQSGVPIILIDRDLKGVSLDGVFQNNYNGSVKAMDALIASGHRNIAIVSGPTTSKPGLDRLNGYLDTLKQNKIPMRNDYILYGDFKKESGYQLTCDLLRRSPEVTAVFCANNMMAIGAIRAIHHAHLSIPDDIALISYGSLDNFDLYQDSFLSELDLPSGIMGIECGKMMLERLQSKQKKGNRFSKRITFDARLILKGSEAFPQNRQR